jgi:hypothetical protein
MKKYFHKLQLTIKMLIEKQNYLCYKIYSMIVRVAVITLQALLIRKPQGRAEMFARRS